ncbi:MAG: hypothetical protein DRP42_04780 [Tenericutes bacterium]|nr:MAG: hypothetical protein DRP42_04780 [Mycoplasmatota bacterium]
MTTLIDSFLGRDDDDQLTEVSAESMGSLNVGKSVLCVDTWFTIKRLSKEKEVMLLSTAEWELPRGKKMASKVVTFKQLAAKVNAGTWGMDIGSKHYGKPKPPPQRSKKKETTEKDADDKATLADQFHPSLTRDRSSLES